MLRPHRHTMISVTALACLISASAVIQAQRRGFFPRESANGTLLLRHPDVQKELKLSDKQKEKLRAIRRKLYENFREAFNDLSREDRHKKFEQLNKEALEDSNRELSEKQQKRLREITLQVNGSAAFENPKIARELNLTKEQIKKIKHHHAKRRHNGKKKMAGLSRKELREGARELRKELEELAEETERKCLKVLDETQKDKWKEMLGEKIELSFRRK